MRNLEQNVRAKLPNNTFKAVPVIAAARLLAGGIILLTVLIGMPALRTACGDVANELECGDRVPDVLLCAEFSGIGNKHMSRKAVIVDKSLQQLLVFQYKGRWCFLRSWPCSTGKKRGAKQREGDQKTPEGVYFITRHVEGRFLSETYGTRALPLNYPNLVDARQGRTGSAIWLHGTNKELKERDSNGCVVMRNADIDQLAGMVTLRQTPVIIVDRIRWRRPSELREMCHTLLNVLDQWHEAFAGGSYHQFQQWYAAGEAPDMAWWDRWCRIRNGKGSASGFVQSHILDRAVLRQSSDIFVVLFDHYVGNGERSVLAGKRNLYFQVGDGRTRIIGDTYQWPVNGRYALSDQDPLFEALKKLRESDTKGNQNGEVLQTVFKPTDTLYQVKCSDR